MERLSEKTYHSLEEAVACIFGKDVRMKEKERVYGGDINDSWKINLSNGEMVFVKINSLMNFKFFTAESLGLWALDSTGKICVPGVLGMGKDGNKGYSFLMLEYIESSFCGKEYWETFGHQLAELHKAESSIFVGNQQHAKFGFLSDNFIGASCQKNSVKEKWIDFYRECRLLPQIQMAEPCLETGIRKRFDDLLENLELYLREPESPSLLHGDLWSGNTLCGSDGNAWILDPAAYVGDFEADLAMTQLFGSFPSVFYDAYHESSAIDREYADRRDLYHLYHLLNHFNLFGGSYLESALTILDRYTL